MNRHWGAIAVVAVVAAAGMTAADAPSETSPQPQQKQPKKQTPAKEKESSLTGCVDEHDGRYVLVDDHDLKPVADLEADGFPTEGFAKHMGHKVTVRGTSTAGGDRPVFKVRAIETVSDTCASQF
ncbi:MAG TPA: hypothetical protein VGF59_05970 [Bryobacteraceae bacterium]|jgi:hypothetical protein